MQPAARRFVIVGALLLALATALGAWAAHGLGRLIDPAGVATFRTGVEYHFYHALGLLALGIVAERCGNDAWLTRGGWLLVAGIALFSGSLYILAFGGGRFLGPVTPLGGLCLIAGWLCAAIAVARQGKADETP